MPSVAENVTLRGAGGGSGPAVAEVTRYGAGARTARAAGFLVAGLAAGGACIVVPGLHLITTWALPLLGAVLAVRALRTTERLERAEGPCPDCGETVELIGGGARTCPRCGTALDVVRSTRVGEEPPG